MTSLALINPKILTWARQRAGLSENVLAEKAQVNVEKVISWEDGTKKPTFNQAQKLAQVTHTPFGYFFLLQPPEEKLPIPDLRTVGSIKLQEVSTELIDTLKNIMLKQEWYKEYLIYQGAEALSFVGSFNLNSSINDVAEDIRKVLGVEPPKQGTWEEYHKKLLDGAESAGILIMRSGIVGNNTHRKLSVHEFRGFAISDPIAPLVFINNSDAPTAKLFTLIHELAHIWIGASGISDLDNHNKEEAFCNKVAGEFLVPERLFYRYWKNENNLLDNLMEIVSHFHVSKLVAAKRALDLGVIDSSIYRKFYQAEMEKYKNNKGSGGSYYNTANSKNGNLFSKAVITEVLSGHLLYRDAGKLLDVNPSKIKIYANELYS